MTGAPARCNRPDCPGRGAGEIDSNGICLSCWLPPLPDGAEVGPESGPDLPPGDEGDKGGEPDAPPPGEGEGEGEGKDEGEGEGEDDRSGEGRSWVGAGIVYVPPAPEIDPDDAIIDDPHIPAHSRTCGSCHTPVGYTADGAPAPEAGECKCGAKYSFDVKLLAGDVVAGQYEVRGVIGHGGQGWVYLAHDINVDRRLCVLKGRRDTGNPRSAEIEEIELRVLAAVQFPGIVEVYNFVEHTTDRDAGTGERPAVHDYIVMAFANGLDLRRLRRERGPIETGRAVAYVHAVLPALGYLHERGYVYCDLKPENMVHSGDAVVLIDLGAVWHPDIPRGNVFSTALYEAPEWHESGPTVATDIYAVGRTLVALLTGSPRTWPVDGAGRPPDVLRRHDGLRRFVERACAPHPEDRFADVDEATEALLGVLCQVAAATKGDARPLTSSRWSPPRTQLEPFGWDALPTPILPTQPFGGPSGSTDDLSWQDRATQALAECRIDDFATAAATAEAIDPRAGSAPAPAPGAVAAPARRKRTIAVVDTARTYLRAIVQQAADEAGETASTSQCDPAVDLFRAAYLAAPGELACALALAAAIEAAAQAILPEAAASDDARAEAEALKRSLLEEAEMLYRQVAVTNPSWVGAIAGRARALLELGDPVEAAHALLKVPLTHPLRLEALALACRSMPSGEYDDTVAEKAGEELARARSHRRPIEEAELAAALYRMAYKAAPKIADMRDPVTGEPASVEELAAACAAALHDQAMATPEVSARHALLDEAAEVRPWRTW